MNASQPLPGKINPLRLIGELTIYTASDTKAMLMERLAEGCDLEIDLSGVTEMDTAGLQLLILARREVEQAGHRLNLLNHSHTVVDVLDTLNMAAYFGDPVPIPSR